MTIDSSTRALRAAAALALVAAAACGESKDPAIARAARAEKSSAAIVIGAAWPWEAHKDVLYRQGMELAVEEINGAGGVLGRPLQLVRADDEASVDRGRMVAEEFSANLDMVAVIGHLQSYVTVPSAAIYEASGLVLLSPASTTPELTSKGYSRVFRTIFTDAEQGKQLAEFAYRKGHRRYVIYYARSEYGRGLANAFEARASALGATVVDRQAYDPSSSGSAHNAEQTAASWSRLQYDLVLIAGQDQQGALLARALRKAGSTAPILGGDALATPSFMAVGGDAVEGAVLATPFHPGIPDPEVRRFSAAFSRRFGKEPDVGAAQGYDAVRILAEGIREAKAPVPEKIAAALRGMRTWQGLAGRIGFDAAGNVVGMPIRTLVVRNGRFEYLRDDTTTSPAAAR